MNNVENLVALVVTQVLLSPQRQCVPHYEVKL